MKPTPGFAAASFAICCCFVNTSILGSVSSPVVFSLQQFPMPGSPPPSLLGGSLGSVRHLSSGATRLLRLPLLVTRLFVFLRVVLTSLPPFHFARFGYSEFLSRCAWALVGRFRPCSGSFAGEEVRRISQVPREPFSAFALLSDPGRISTPSQLRRFEYSGSVSQPLCHP